MAAPTFGAAGTASAGTGASVTPTLPAGIAANDIVIVWAVSCCAVADTETTAFTWPANYTEGAAVPIFDASANATGLAGWAWKRTTGADSGTITVTRDGTTGASTSFISNCVACTGCRTSGDPFETQASNNPNYSATIDWPAVTTTGPNDSLLILFLDGDNVNIGTPANYTAIVSNASTQGKDSAADADKRENVAAGTYDPANATLGANDNTGWATFQIAFTDQALATSLIWQPSPASLYSR